MIYTVKGLKHEDERTYNGPSYTVIAHKNSCEFCANFDGVLWDYTNGPYMYFCSKHIEVSSDILRNGCDQFMEGDVTDEQI